MTASECNRNHERNFSACLQITYIAQPARMAAIHACRNFQQWHKTGIHPSTFNYCSTD